MYYLSYSVCVRTRNKERDCNETVCGTHVVGTPSILDGSSSVEVKTSGLKGAGKGLYALQDIERGVEIGTFGGIIECAMCRDTLSKHLHKENNVIEGDEYFNDKEDELVLLNLTRSFRDQVDGVMWYINSSSWNAKVRKLNIEPSAEFIGGGVDERLRPIVGVHTLRFIAAGEEVFIAYSKNGK